MRRSILKYLPFLAFASPNTPGMFKEEEYVPSGTGKYRHNPHKSGMTKKQMKARVRGKMAKQSRKLNYKKAK